MNRSVTAPLRWYAIGVGLGLALSLHDAIALADPLDEPWRIARADPLSRLRSDDVARRRGGAYSLVRARLAGAEGTTASERAAQDDALLALLVQETDLAARLTAVAALSLPPDRDARALAARVEALRLGELAPPALALAALHALGSTEALLDAARARGSVVPDDELAAVALDALALRPSSALEGRAVEEPLRWRVLAQRGDPSIAAAVVAELGRAAEEIRGGRGMSAIRAARALRLADAAPALLAVARRGPERELRRQAAAALGDVGGVTDAELGVLLDDPVVRGPTLAAIGRLGARGALAAVRGCLTLDDPADRRAAEEALAALGSPARVEAPVGPAAQGSTPALERVLLTDADDGRRVAAAEALARREGARALPSIAAARAVAWSAAMASGLRRAEALARAAAEP
jgi:hypothetical protein